MRHTWLIARRVFRGALPRLMKLSKDNIIGIALLLTTILYEAHLHSWSRQTILSDIWENIVAPCLLVLCGLFSIHLIQSAHELYKEESRPFPNALGTITSIPPWRFRWRCYLVTSLYLTLPVTQFFMIWSPALLTDDPNFIVNQNTNVILPDLRVLNDLPSTPTKDKDKPPSLLDLFTQDYPTDMKAQNNLTMRGSVLPLKQQVYLDFLSRSEFVGLYVPGDNPVTSEKTAVAVCKAFAGHVQPMLNMLQKNSFIQGGMGQENARTISELTFTRVAIIYHEALLNDLDKADIIESFKAKELDVQFRGPEYEESRRIAWVNSHNQHQ